jgi:hypothetical protein
MGVCSHIGRGHASILAQYITAAEFSAAVAVPSTIQEKSSLVHDGNHPLHAVDRALTSSDETDEYRALRADR